MDVCPSVGKGFSCTIKAYLSGPDEGVIFIKHSGDFPLMNMCCPLCKHFARGVSVCLYCLEFPLETSLKNKVTNCSSHLPRQVKVLALTQPVGD